MILYRKLTFKDGTGDYEIFVTDTKIKKSCILLTSYSNEITQYTDSIWNEVETFNGNFCDESIISKETAEELMFLSRL